MRLTYVGPHDAVEIPGIADPVEADETLDVEDDDLARSLLEQRGNFEPADDESREFVSDLDRIAEVVASPAEPDLTKLNLRQLRTFADDHSIDLGEAKLKADVLAVVKAHVNPDPTEES